MNRKPILIGLKNGMVTHLSVYTNEEERIEFIKGGCDTVITTCENIDVPDFESKYQIKLEKV